MTALLIPMTLDEAALFIRQNDISTSCPACGHSHAETPTHVINGKEVVQFGVLETIAPPIPPQYEAKENKHLTLPMVCAQCGYIRHFMASHVRRSLGYNS
ncbi:hypothetical protein VP758_001553 [Vibrio harveyi]|nr:hypothetical protein [Vibrio harveyi]